MPEFIELILTAVNGQRRGVAVEPEVVQEGCLEELDLGLAESRPLAPNLSNSVHQIGWTLF